MLNDLFAAHVRDSQGIPILSRMMMPWMVLLALVVGMTDVGAQENGADSEPIYQVWPIGWVRKSDGATWIEIESRYQPSLLGLEAGATIWVLYWLDRNDTPEQRAIQQVHPRGNPANPLRGVFATHAPVRPNLIALSRCRVLAVKGTHIGIEDIDAFADTPVLDIKPAD